MQEFFQHFGMVCYWVVYLLKFYMLDMYSGVAELHYMLCDSNEHKEELEM